MKDYLLYQIWLSLIMLVVLIGMTQAPSRIRFRLCMGGLAIWFLPVQMIQLDVFGSDSSFGSTAILNWVRPSVDYPIPVETTERAFHVFILVCLIGLILFLTELRRYSYFVKKLSRYGYQASLFRQETNQPAVEVEVRQAARLGFDRAIVCASKRKRGTERPKHGLELIEVRSVANAVELAFDRT